MHCIVARGNASTLSHYNSSWDVNIHYNIHLIQDVGSLVHVDVNHGVNTMCLVDTGPVIAILNKT